MPWLRSELRRLLRWAGTQAHPVDPTAVAPGPRGLPAYAAVGHWTPAAFELEHRLAILVGQFAAELSGCRWCIEQGRHQWRQAFLPQQLLDDLGRYRTSPLFSPRERAALALTEAVARYTAGEPGAAEAPLARAREQLREGEIARIAQVASAAHFFNPATGAIGLDAAMPSLAAPLSAATPDHRIETARGET